VPPPDDGRLADIEAIQRLKARYLRCMDDQRWEELGDVFTEDAVVVDAEHPQGRAGIVSHVRGLLAGGRTVHSAELEAIEIAGERMATAVWAMTDVVELAEGSARLGWVGSGHYHEEYRKEGDTWRIARLRLVRQHRDPLPERA
jgi:uncharacterized protein (TIGR02246 family)